MPFWHGDAVGRPYELGRAVGEFLRRAEELGDEQLAADHGLDARAIGNLRAYLAEERQVTGGSLPTDQQLVIERFRDELGDWRVCVLSPFGARVHAPWALAIEAKVRDRLGLEVQAIWSDDGIVVRLPEADESPPTDFVVLDPAEVEDLVVGQVGASALFAARFRENAARSLLLPRRRPGSRTPLWQQRQRAADLLAVASKYGSFPVLLETYRECLRDVFDLPALTELMTAIRARTIRVVSVDTAAPSPFAQSLAFGNLDAASQIFHTITACQSQCTGSTGISYPLANGPIDFDSGDLGYGPSGFTAAANRAQWKTPATLPLGTYTYFCRIHPYMRGAFRVVR